VSPVSDLATRRKINKGFGEGMTRAVEIVVAPLLMGLVGWLLDGWWGTAPFAMLGLGLYGVVGVFVRLWFAYDREMKAEEAKLPGAAR